MDLQGKAQEVPPDSKNPDPNRVLDQGSIFLGLCIYVTINQEIFLVFVWGP